METDDTAAQSDRMEACSGLNNERVIFVDPQNTVVDVDQTNVLDPHEELQRILGGTCSDIAIVKQSDFSDNLALEMDFKPAINENNQSNNSSDLVSGEEIIEKLQDVAQFAQDHFPGQVHCLLMYDVNQIPFLTVSI